MPLRKPKIVKLPNTENGEIERNVVIVSVIAETPDRTKKAMDAVWYSKDTPTTDAVVITRDRRAVYIGDITDQRYITENEYLNDPARYEKAYTLMDAPIPNKEFKSQLIEANIY